MKRGQNKKGFTIVELLIVIVVIGILAAITIVAYNGIQTSARDAQRKTDIGNIAKALHIHNVNNGNYVGAASGCGSTGGGNGWLGLDYDGATTTLKSIAQCLVDSGSMSKELRDPSGLANCGFGNVCRAYMKYTCASGTFLYASLESIPAGVDGPTNATCAPAWDTDYGMNYTVKVD